MVRLVLQQWYDMSGPSVIPSDVLGIWWRLKKGGNVNMHAAGGEIDR
jgi:hypothetical protein